MQYTVKQPTAIIQGHGLHTGKPASVQILPAPEGYGLVFERLDVPGINTYVRALYSNVDLNASQRCTFLKNDAGIDVQTPEHIMAALAGYGIDNAIIQLAGSEVPIVDGSAKPFFDALAAVGRKQQGMRNVMVVTAPVRVEYEGKFAELTPLAAGQAPHLHLDYGIEFDGLGTQQMRVVMDGHKSFLEIADSRTFAKLSDVEKLRKAGLIKGGSLEIALIINDLRDQPDAESRDVFYNKPRYADEPVRHKIMDAVGDLALAGMPIIGQFNCSCGGHVLTNRLLRAVFADPQRNFEVVRELAGLQTPIFAPLRTPDSALVG